MQLYFAILLVLRMLGGGNLLLLLQSFAALLFTCFVTGGKKRHPAFLPNFLQMDELLYCSEHHLEQQFSTGVPWHIGELNGFVLF